MGLILEINQPIIAINMTNNTVECANPWIRPIIECHHSLNVTEVLECDQIWIAYKVKESNQSRIATSPRTLQVLECDQF